MRRQRYPGAVQEATTHYRPQRKGCPDVGKQPEAADAARAGRGSAGELRNDLPVGERRQDPGGGAHRADHALRPGRRQRSPAGRQERVTKKRRRDFVAAAKAHRNAVLEAHARRSTSDLELKVVNAVALFTSSFGHLEDRIELDRLAAVVYAVARDEIKPWHRNNVNAAGKRLTLGRDPRLRGSPGSAPKGRRQRWSNRADRLPKSRRNSPRCRWTFRRESHARAG